MKAGVLLSSLFYFYFFFVVAVIRGQASPLITLVTERTTTNAFMVWVSKNEL